MPSRPDDTPTVARISLRTIAAQTGVSAMTVSKALRHLPKISRRTRAKVLRVAAKLGYRPDPQLAKLMVHLRRPSASDFHSLICALSNRSAGDAHPYQGELVAGAEAQAKNRGYGFASMTFDSTDPHGRQLRRILSARGVEGVLLLPMREAVDLSGLLPWAEFSAVSVTSSLLGPAVHRVTPNHFANTARICAELTARGYRRLGLIIDARQELRVGHAFSAAIVRHNLDRRRVSVAPFIYERLDPTALVTWFSREAPDAIVATDVASCREYARLLRLRIPGAVGFASTNTHAETGIAGIDELPRAVGAAALDLLVGLIQHGERGLPAHPIMSGLAGTWVDGTSCPTRTAKREPHGREVMRRGPVKSRKAR